MRLIDMFSMIEQLDGDGLELPTELAADLHQKVDAYVSAMDHIEADIERFKELAKMFKEKAAAKENQLAQFKEYTLKSMQAFGWDELRGDARKLKVIKQKRFKILRQPGEEDFNWHKDFVIKDVTISYRWDQDLLKLRQELIEDAFTVVDSAHVRKT